MKVSLLYIKSNETNATTGVNEAARQHPLFPVLDYIA